MTRRIALLVAIMFVIFSGNAIAQGLSLEETIRFINNKLSTCLGGSRHFLDDNLFHFRWYTYEELAQPHKEKFQVLLLRTYKERIYNPGLNVDYSKNFIVLSSFDLTRLNPDVMVKVDESDSDRSFLTIECSEKNCIDETWLPSSETREVTEEEIESKTSSVLNLFPGCSSKKNLHKIAKAFEHAITMSGGKKDPF